LLPEMNLYLILDLNLVTSPRFTGSESTWRTSRIYTQNPRSCAGQISCQDNTERDRDLQVKRDETYQAILIGPDLVSISNHSKNLWINWKNVKIAWIPQLF
jgi:hypothetical protein